MGKLCLSLLLFCCCCASLSAEQVTLKNGDRITGAIVSLDSKKLTVKTEYAGVITIDWDSVAQFTSAQPMIVTRTDNQTLSGPVTAQESSVVVTAPAGPQTIPQAEVAFIRSPADQAAYEKSLHPGLLQGWSGGGTFGVALARGNSDTTNIATGFLADRKTSTDEWNLTFAQLYSTNTTNNVSSQTANALGGTIRYDHNLTKRLFAFGLLTGMYDHFQDLDVRLSPNGGLGYHVIASKMTTLDVLGGFGYTYERYSTPLTNNFINASVGEELTHNFTANTSVYERLYFFPYLNDAGNYRGTFDFGISSRMYRALTWNFVFGDIYNSAPVDGKRNNDLVLTTGVGLTFGQKPK
jgi:putative salt-induced outer membrane protein YdiY